MGGDRNAFVVVTYQLNNLYIYKRLIQGQNLKHITIDSLPQINERLNNNRSLPVVNTDLIEHQEGLFGNKKASKLQEMLDDKTSQNFEQNNRVS